MEDAKKTSTQDQTRFGFGLGVGLALLLVWLLFSHVADVPDSQAIVWIPVLSFVAGIIRNWYPNLTGAITYSSGILLVTLIGYSANLGLSLGWYHALFGLLMHHVGNILLIASQQKKRS